MKFQDTVILLQDYYASLQGVTPAQLISPARIPLIEVIHGTLSYTCVAYQACVSRQFSDLELVLALVTG